MDQLESRIQVDTKVIISVNKICVVIQRQEESNSIFLEDGISQVIMGTRFVGHVYNLS